MSKYCRHFIQMNECLFIVFLISLKSICITLIQTKAWDTEILKAILFKESMKI